MPASITMENTGVRTQTLVTTACPARHGSLAPSPLAEGSNMPWPTSRYSGGAGQSRRVDQTTDKQRARNAQSQIEDWAANIFENAIVRGAVSHGLTHAMFYMLGSSMSAFSRSLGISEWRGTEEPPFLLVGPLSASGGERSRLYGVLGLSSIL